MHRQERRPACVANFESLAASKIPEDYWKFVKSGAEREVTLRDNEQAFDRIRLRPRVLTGHIGHVNLSTTLLGSKVTLPIGVCPTGYHRVVWPDGELSSARAADELGICYTISTATTTSMQSMVDATPGGLKWLQLYIFRQREVTEKVVREAEKVGMKAIVLTVDAPAFGSRWRVKGIPLKFPAGVETKLYEQKAGQTDSAAGKIVDYIDPLCSWTDVLWLKKITALPIVLKGVLTREDAILAIQHGVSAIWVSNHGGRQLDGVLASIDALPEVVEAVDGRVEVYVDGGVRTGTDVLKALAIGAKAVFIGRPVLWGLAVNGDEGIKDVINILKDELETAMMLSGCGSVQHISRSLIQRKPIQGKL